jgi:mono/diheme cytochrome c family protein
MKKLFPSVLILGLAGVSLILVAQTSSVVLPQDKGPDKIDVSAYPAEMQKAYKVFAGKCSKCHTIARPINTMMSRDEWERYVKRMMHKPNSGINDSQGKDIFGFLNYDQTHRKDKDPKAFFRALTDEEIQKLPVQK